MLALTIELVFFVARLELEHLRLGRVVRRDARHVLEVYGLAFVAAEASFVRRIFVDEGTVVL